MAHLFKKGRLVDVDLMVTNLCRDEEDVEDCSLTVEERNASKQNSFARREQILVPPVSLLRLTLTQHSSQL